MSIFCVFIWGTKRKLTRLGYVADFCPICRQVRPFSVSRVSRAGHIYYISFGGKFVGYLSECQICHLNLSANPNFYQTVSKSLSSDVPDLKSLIQETFPNLNQHYRNRLEVEEQIKLNPRSLPADIRSALIEEPFHLLSSLVEARLSSKARLDRENLFGSLFMIVVFVLFRFDMLPSSIHDWLSGFIYLVILGGSVYTIVQLVLSKQRELDREVVPLLARCLKPLSPNLDELQACLNKLAILKQRIGRRLKAQQLLTAIEHLGVDSFHISSR